MFLQWEQLSHFIDSNATVKQKIFQQNDCIKTKSVEVNSVEYRIGDIICFPRSNSVYFGRIDRFIYDSEGVKAELNSYEAYYIDVKNCFRLCGSSGAFTTQLKDLLYPWPTSQYLDATDQLLAVPRCLPYDLQ
jgi:hypothetical protein